MKVIIVTTQTAKQLHKVEIPGTTVGEFKANLESGNFTTLDGSEVESFDLSNKTFTVKETAMNMDFSSLGLKAKLPVQESKMEGFDFTVYMISQKPKSGMGKKKDLLEAIEIKIAEIRQLYKEYHGEEDEEEESFNNSLSEEEQALLDELAMLENGH